MTLIQQKTQTRHPQRNNKPSGFTHEVQFTLSFCHGDVIRQEASNDSLSSSVLCSTASVRTFTFSGCVRGRLGVMRLTAAVLRKRLARPSVGELNQLGRARAPPTAAAPNGLCGYKRRGREEMMKNVFLFLVSGENL